MPGSRCDLVKSYSLSCLINRNDLDLTLNRTNEHSTTDPSSSTIIRRLENAVILLLQSLPGVNLNEKIKGLMQSVAQNRQQLKKMKEQLIEERDQSRSTQKKIEDKLQIKLDNQQIQQTDTGSVFGMEEQMNETINQWCFLI